MRVKFNTDLEIVIQDVEVEGKTIQEATESLLKMSVEDLLQYSQYYSKREFKEIEISEIENVDVTFKVNYLEYELDEDLFESPDAMEEYDKALQNRIVGKTFTLTCDTLDDEEIYDEICSFLEDEMDFTGSVSYVGYDIISKE